MTPTYREARTLAAARWTTSNGIAFNLAGWCLAVALRAKRLGIAYRLINYRNALTDRFAERRGLTDDLRSLRALERVYGREAS